MQRSQTGVNVVYSDYKAVMQSSIVDQFLYESGCDVRTSRLFEFATTDALRIFQEQHSAKCPNDTHHPPPEVGHLPNIFLKHSSTARPDHGLHMQALISLLSPAFVLWRHVKNICESFIYQKNFELEARSSFPPSWRNSEAMVYGVGREAQ